MYSLPAQLDAQRGAVGAHVHADRRARPASASGREVVALPRRARRRRRSPRQPGARGSPRSRAAVAALAIVSSRASPRAVALASSLEAPDRPCGSASAATGAACRAGLRNFDQSCDGDVRDQLARVALLRARNACLSGRQLTRLPTFTLTWRFLHFLGFFLRLGGVVYGNGAEGGLGGERRAAGTASAAITASTITTRVRTRTRRYYARFAWLASLGYCLRRRDLDRPANSWRLV